MMIIKDINKYLKLLFATFFLLTFSSFLYAQEHGQLLDRVIAVVNNEAITQSELDVMLRPIYEDYKQEYKGEQLFKQLAIARQKLLNQLIEDRLVYQKAKELEVKVDPGLIEEHLEEFKQRFPDNETLEEALKMQGMTLGSIRDRFQRQEMIRQLHNMEVRSRVVVSPTDLQKYFNDHPDEFSQQERVKVRSITIKKSIEAREKGLKDENAWQMMNEIQTKLKQGEPFEKLAKDHSEDTRAEEGGLSEWIDRHTMIPAIDEIIFSLKPGEVSQAIETEMGLHLFQLVERQDGESKTFEEVREQIRTQLYNEKLEKRFNEWMEELKKSAYISVR
ncbi:MAG: peptidylprolyl isomerase [Candidatus Omnitrophica bacterium]|nr:peptidylprolyl isomerase [Candidatus Omnitrophota bacterium]